MGLTLEHEIVASVVSVREKFSTNDLMRDSGSFAISFLVMISNAGIMCGIKSCEERNVLGLVVELYCLSFLNSISIQRKLDDDLSQRTKSLWLGN